MKDLGSKRNTRIPPNKARLAKKAHFRVIMCITSITLLAGSGNEQLEN